MLVNKTKFLSFICWPSQKSKFDFLVSEKQRAKKLNYKIWDFRIKKRKENVFNRIKKTVLCLVLLALSNPKWVPRSSRRFPWRHSQAQNYCGLKRKSEKPADPNESQHCSLEKKKKIMNQLLCIMTFWKENFWRFQNFKQN